MRRGAARSFARSRPGRLIARALNSKAIAFSRSLMLSRTRHAPSALARAATFAGVALVGLASGCGSATHSVTQGQAAAFARAVNLRQILGMSSEGRAEPKGQAVRFELTPSQGCGRSDRGERFDFYSPIFRRSPSGRHVHAGFPLPLPAEGLHSKVSVMPSTAEQERDFSARACDMASEARKPNAQRLPSPLLGVRVLGLRTWRTAPRYMFGRTNVLLYSDGFSFVAGPAEVKLALTSASRPPNSGREHYLLSQLDRRAKYYSPLLAGKKVPPEAGTVLVIR